MGTVFSTYSKRSYTPYQRANFFSTGFFWSMNAIGCLASRVLPKRDEIYLSNIAVAQK